MASAVFDVQDLDVQSVISVWLCHHAPDLMYNHCFAASEAALHVGRTLAALHCPCEALHLDDGAFA